MIRNLVVIFLKTEDGITALEYGLIASVVSAAIIGSLMLIGPSLATAFQFIANCF